MAPGVRLKPPAAALAPALADAGSAARATARPAPVKQAAASGSASAQPTEFTVSVRASEAKTRLDFMAELTDDEEARVEAEKAGVW